jgi:uncharacterized secreted protein with C-terminal beta-propeller domain
MNTKKAFTAVAAGVLLFAAGTAVGLRAGGPAGQVPPEAPPVTTRPGEELVLTAALSPFDDCQALVEHYRDVALHLVGPYGLPGVGGSMIVQAAGASERAGGGEALRQPAPAPAAADTAEAVGPGATGTNVQEAGVDEPDLVKTNGDLIVAVAGGGLQVIEPGDLPRVVGTLDLSEQGYPSELLIDGDRALVLTRTQGFARPVDHTDYLMVGTTSVLTAVDLSDPAEPRVEATLTVDGDYRSARVVDGVARIVVASQPTALPFEYPQVGGLRAEREAEQRNRDIVEEATEQDWLPWAVLEDGDGRTVSEGPVVECGDVARPPGFTGLGTLSVLTVDLSADLDISGATGVVAQGETVYASPERLYVATPDYGDPRALTDPRFTPAGGQIETTIHVFDLTDPATAPHVASGRVAGTLLNSYAMSGDGTTLRVATTTQPGWWGGSAPETDPSQSSVVVLAERGDALEEVGRLDGLGVTETIRGVRFLGDLAAVVTFRQTDPLYLVDLSDPTDPSLLGELKIPGYSAYLHPVGDDRLLGVGQDATDQGQVLGVQASLFDLADRANPTRVDQADLEASYALVEADPRAFLYWPDTELAVVPTYDGAAAVRVTGDRLETLGTLDKGAPVNRALVVGDLLYTITETGITAHGLQTLEELGSADFSRA